MGKIGIIRRYTKSDESATVGVWYRTGKEAYPYLPQFQALTFEKAVAVFRQLIPSTCDIWIGEEHQKVIAYLAMKDSYIDRLYVDPTQQNLGWGTRFVEHAKEIQPQGLELHTHQANTNACRFYERLGFVAVNFGISPAPESEPDVEYHWRPGK